MTITSFEKRVEILSDISIKLKNNPEAQEFIENYDIGLPLATAIRFDFATPTPKGIEVINETFQALMDGLDNEDVGFDNMDEVLDGGVPIKPELSEEDWEEMGEDE